MRSFFFRCAACRKLHILYSGVACPCGEPFPDDYKHKVYR